MLNGKKIVVVMPAYNAEKTLKKTHDEVPMDVVDSVIVIDDYSTDRTVEIARELGLDLFVHDRNKGYGANQKTCYKLALEKGADIVIMLHPDYQYPPKLIPAMASLISLDVFDVVLGTRVLDGMALKGGMPIFKYIFNKILTFAENIMMCRNLSEYHTGYRAFSREVLESMPIMENSDDFVFDNQILAQAIYFGYRIGEITSPSQYTNESSSIGFGRSVVYSFGVMATSVKFLMQKWNLRKFSMFDRRGGRKVL